LTDIRFDQVNVLLIDDSAFARSVGQRVLRNTGVGSVLLAPSGQEAIALLSKVGDAVDVVFCDLMMPDMDGIQFIRCVAALATKPAFVLLSGADPALLNAAEDTARARSLRVLGVIQKPLTSDGVRRVLLRLGDRRNPIHDRRATIDVTPQDFDAAIEEEQFRIHFQPKVSVADGTVAGFEALARWPHPDKGMIPPSTFITAAERSGRIERLTRLVTTLALEQSSKWAAEGLRTKVSINLSAHMLVDLDLPDRMAQKSLNYGVSPGNVILEITESGLFQDTADTLDILARLHMKGFPLSIDDFGTGYSSMEQLRRVPFAEMKIDRAFVNGASENPKAKAILESSAVLGKSLQMSVVAEGAETREDLEAVRGAGVDLVQGYFIARPMPAEDVPAWLERSAAPVKFSKPA
jgi:EAL domain-containing protein (putative c-di-GMP-specific phosphodiesterase class I)